MKNKKAALKFSFLVLGLITISAIIIYASFVLANTHTSSVKITSCTTIGDLGECIIAGGITDHNFDLEVCNDAGSPHDIREFRIYYEWEDFDDFTNVDCKSKTGWDDTVITTIWGKACLYSSEAEANNIEPNECTDFKFTADTPTKECCRELRFETTDEETPVGDVNEIYAQVCIDATAPETTKSFDGPQKEEGGVEWIDGVTKVVLDAVDPTPHPSGVDETYYINILAEEFVEQYQLKCNPETPCLDPGYCQSLLQYADHIQGWQSYDVPFPKEGESCHVLFYYSEDNVGNEEDMQVNCFFVDTTAPLLEKDNGDAIPDSGGDMFITNDNPDGDFHWLTTDMPITFTCDDTHGGDTELSPHPSEDEELCFKVSYDYPQWDYITREYCSGGTMNQEDYCCVEVDGNNEYEFYFKEESMHNLEYYCIDAVEKDSDVHIQYYKVDDTPPKITKTIEGPQVGDCPPEEGDKCWIADHDTHIIINAIDGGDICAIDEVECKWGYWLDGKFYGSWYPCEGSHCDITFPQETEHELHVKCWDALGNEVEDIETFYVDSSGPTVEKEFIGPQKIEPIPGTPFAVEWIDGITTIELIATDHPAEPCGVDDNTIYYINDIDETERACLDPYTYCHPTHNPNPTGDGWTEYTGPFTKDESCHILEFYAVDKLGNVGPVDVNCFFVDKTKPITEKWYEGPQYSDGLSGYSFTETVVVSDGSVGSLEVTVTDEGDWMVWTFDFPVEQFTGDGNLNLGLIIATDGEGQGPEFQIHNNDGADPNYAWGTWLMSPYDTGLASGCNWLGWHSSCVNTPVTSLSWVEATGNRNVPHGDGILQVKIKKSDLGESFHWAASPTVGSGFFAPAYDVTMQIPTAFSWSTPIVDMTVPNYIYAKGYSKWITSETDVFLSASDPKPHPSGVAATFYRDIYLDDPDDWHYCSTNCETWQTDIPPPEPMNPDPAKGWTEWTGTPFNKEPESCHIIEYYSVDNVGKVEDIQWQCVFVDNKKPEITKEIIGPQEGDCPPTNLNGVVNGNNHEEEKCYIDGITEILVDATDPEPHPVNEVLCDWWYILDDGGQYYAEYVDDEWVQVPGKAENVLIPFRFSFPEETKHDLWISCWDALGNGEDDQHWDHEVFYVDKTPPITTKTYGTPHYPADINDPADYPHYITSETEVWLSASDEYGLHDSGIAKTFYRDVYLPDEIDWDYCYETCNNWENDPRYSAYGLPTAPEPYNPKLIDDRWEEWTDEPFFKEPESCHIIEYYSYDNVGKVEKPKWQCVFVDNSPPTPIKTVDEPKTEWYPVDVATDPLDPDATHFYGAGYNYPDWENGIVDKCWNGQGDEIECWKVTLDTKISMDCTDPDPHPVDNEKVCFQVEMDGEDITNKEGCVHHWGCGWNQGYCDKYGGEMIDGWCCVDHTIENFKFKEESEHNLKYYCEDALGNGGPGSDNWVIDEEKFKVTGKMFKIRINDKWNLISVPFVLLNDDPAEVFEDTPSVQTVWGYDENGDWHVFRPGGDGTNDLDSIEPGYGYWVLADCEEPEYIPRNFNFGCGGPDGDKCEMLVVGGSLYNPGPVVPPNVKVGSTEEGWNLIGYYGTEGRWGYKGPNAWYGWWSKDGKDAYCALYSLRNLNEEESTKWSALVGYWEPDNPKAWYGLELCDEMDPGAGYWISMDAEGNYKPSTICDEEVCEDHGWFGGLFT